MFIRLKNNADGKDLIDRTKLMMEEKEKRLARVVSSSE